MCSERHSSLFVCQSVCLSDFLLHAISTDWFVCKVAMGYKYRLDAESRELRVVVSRGPRAVATRGPEAHYNA